MFTKLFTSRITLVLSFLLLAAGLVAGVALIRYPQILFPEAAEVQCPNTTGPFDLYCTWNAPAGTTPADGVKYDFLVQDSDGEIRGSGQGISETYGTFTGYPDITYTCKVSAYNNCGSVSSLAESRPPFSCTAPAPTPQAPQWALNGVWQDPKEGHHCAVQVWFTQNQEEVQHLRVEIWPEYDRVLNGVDRYRRVDFNKGEEDRDSTQVKYFAPDDQGRINVQFLNAIIKPGDQDEAWQAKVTAFSENDASEASIQKQWGNHPTCRGNNMPGYTPPPPAATVTPVPECKEDINGGYNEACCCTSTDCPINASGYHQKCNIDNGYCKSNNSCNPDEYETPITPVATATPVPGACLEPYAYCTQGESVCCDNGGDYDCLYHSTIPDIDGSPKDIYACQPVPAETGTISGTVTVNGTVPSGKYLIVRARIDPSGSSDYESRLINSSGSPYSINIPTGIAYVHVSREYRNANGTIGGPIPGVQVAAPNCPNPGDIAYTDCILNVPAGGTVTQNFTITIPADLPPGGTGVGTQGDISGPEGEPDGVVDAADVSVLMSNWGLPFGFNPSADLNGDGKVDALDASLLIQGWSGK